MGNLGQLFKAPNLLFYFLPLQGALYFFLLAAHTRPPDRSSEARLGRAWTVHHDSDSRCNSLPDSSPNLPGNSAVELLGAHGGQDAAVIAAPGVGAQAGPRRPACRRAGRRPARARSHPPRGARRMASAPAAGSPGCSRHGCRQARPPTPGPAPSASRGPAAPRAAALRMSGSPASP